MGGPLDPDAFPGDYSRFDTLGSNNFAIRQNDNKEHLSIVQSLDVLNPSTP